MHLGVASEDTYAARVLATAVAHPSEERFVLDAGTKAFTSGAAPVHPTSEGR